VVVAGRFEVRQWVQDRPRSWARPAGGRSVRSRERASCENALELGDTYQGCGQPVNQLGVDLAALQFFIEAIRNHEH